MHVSLAKEENGHWPHCTSSPKAQRVLIPLKRSKQVHAVVFGSNFATPKHVVKCTNACREGENHRSLPQLLKDLNQQAEGKHPSQVALGGAVSQPMHVVIHVSPDTPIALSIKCCKAADILSCLTWRQKSWLSNAHNRKFFFFCQTKQEIVCAERWKQILKNIIETFNS